jgi:hypothetical protein
MHNGKRKNLYTLTCVHIRTHTWSHMYVFTHTSLCTWFRVGFKGLLPSDFLEVLRPFCYLSIHLSSSRQKYKIRCIRSYHYHHISLLPSYIINLIINDFSPFAVAVPRNLHALGAMRWVSLWGWAYSFIGSDCSETWATVSDQECDTHDTPKNSLALLQAKSPLTSKPVAVTTSKQTIHSGGFVRIWRLPKIQTSSVDKKITN